MATHNDFGKESETYSCELLEKKGYKILKKNFRYRYAEIDIIAQWENTLVVVEVKARTTVLFGNPESFVTAKKIRLLSEAAHQFCIQNDWKGEVRFDIISITKQQGKLIAHHIEDAFYPFSE